MGLDTGHPQKFETTYNGLAIGSQVILYFPISLFPYRPVNSCVTRYIRLQPFREEERPSSPFLEYDPQKCTRTDGTHDDVEG